MPIRRRTPNVCSIVLAAIAATSSPALAGSATWNGPSGDYNVAANWTPATVPNGVLDVATFATMNGTVSVNVSPTLYGMRFTSAGAFTLAGTNTISMPGGATIDVQSGFPQIYSNLTFTGTGATIHTAAAPVRTYLYGNVTTAQPNTVINKTGPGLLVFGSAATSTFAAGSTLAVSGGTLEVAGDFDGNLVASNGSTVRFASLQGFSDLELSDGGTQATIGSQQDTNSSLKIQVRDLKIGEGATFDLRRGTLLVDHDVDEGNNTFGELNSLLKAAVSGNQPGTGLISSSAAASGGRYAVGLVEANTIGSPRTFGGYIIDDTTTIARYALRGDTDLNGNIDFDDLLRLAEAYSKPGTWVNGDSDYSGTVDFNDLLALARNYGNPPPRAESLAAAAGDAFAADYALAVSVVPEPSAALAVIGLLAGRVRRRAAAPLQPRTVTTR